MCREGTRTAHTLSSDRTKKDPGEPRMDARLTLLESGMSVRKSAGKNGLPEAHMKAHVMPSLIWGNQRFMSDTDNGWRHVPPRKLQRRAYAAEAGSDAPARGEWQGSVFMPGSVASAALCGNPVADVSSRFLVLSVPLAIARQHPAAISYVLCITATEYCV
jgi:hypothetical protein